MEKLTKRKLGIVGVDSGQLMICDPCYIDSEWKHEKTIDLTNKKILEKHKGKFSYNGSCEATLSSKSSGQLNYKMGHPGAGVVFTSGYGDGTYPVIGWFNKEGRCIKVEIDCGITPAQKKFFKSQRGKTI